MVDYATNKVTETIQPEDGVSHCSKLEKTHGLINPWTQSLHEINNIYRGCYLWPKTYFMLDDSRGKHAGKQIIIDTLELDDALYEAHKNQPLLVADQDKHEINEAVINLLIKPE
jgi:methionyl-tRNA formyltransferase